MNRRLGILIVLIVAVAGCGRDASPRAAQSTPATEATSSAVAQNPQEAAGNIPDPCTLLSDAEVAQLTGRDITQIDKDGADATASTRYCQWQQSSGQLAVFLSRTTGDDFNVAQADSPSVPGRSATTRTGGTAICTCTSARSTSTCTRVGPTSSRARPRRKRLRERYFRRCKPSPDLTAT